MKLVSTDPRGFCQVASSQVSPDNTLILAHADGTISVFDDNLQLLSAWLNPGRRVSAMAVVDSSLLVAFTDLEVVALSLESGLALGRREIPYELSDFVVLERIVVGWSRRRSSLCLFHRFNFELFQEISCASSVTSVLAASGRICVICNTGIYWLQPLQALQSPDSRKRDDMQKWTLHPVLPTTEYLIIDACLYNRGLLLLSPDYWRLLSFENEGLKEELSVNAPLNTLFKMQCQTSDTILIQCTGSLYVVLREGNIQVLSPPRSPQQDAAAEVLVKNHLGVISEKMEFFQLKMGDSGEFEWQQRALAAQYTAERTLIGERNPKITAVCESNGVRIVGTEDGKVDGKIVFAAPVLHIDKSEACTRDSRVSMLIQPINAVLPMKRKIEDKRVTSSVEQFDWEHSHWAGLAFDGSVFMFKASDRKAVPSYMAVVMALEERVSFETALKTCDKSPAAVSNLEELAVLACERGHQKMLEMVAQFLACLWHGQRIDELLRAGGPRSLKLLASTSSALCLKIEESQIMSVLHRLSHASDAASADAVLWVYENDYEGVRTLPLPFEALSRAAPSRLKRFAEKIVVSERGARRLLQDVKSVVDAEIAECPDGFPRLEVEATATRLLLATLELPAPLRLPQTDMQLVSIVQMVVPAVQRRIPQAKAILVALLASHHIQFHQGRQRLLVPTLDSQSQLGFVFEMNRPNVKTPLGRPLNMSDSLKHCPVLGFSGDGKSVNGVLGTQKFAWSLSRGIQGLFTQQSEPIVPVELKM